MKMWMEILFSLLNLETGEGFFRKEQELGRGRERSEKHLRALAGMGWWG